MSVNARIWPVICVIWALIILVVSVIPGDELPSISIWEPDKIMHALVYGILTLLLYRTFKVKSTFSNKKSAYIAFILCILYGFLIEVIQLLLPDRSFDLWDVLANGTGCLVSLVCILIFSAS